MPVEINPTIIEKLGAKAQPTYEVDKEIDPKEHAIYDESKRKRKTVVKPIMGSDGKPEKDDKGNIKTRTETIDPTRLSLSLQDIIVTRRVAFMNLGRVKLTAEPSTDQEKRAFNLLQRLRENNKVSFKESEIATILNEELQVAKLYYSVDTDDASHWGGLSNVKKDFKMQILAPSKGDNLLPVFDSRANLVYFGRGYTRTVDILELIANGGDAAEAEKEIKCLDIYSKDFLYRFEQGDGVKGEQAEGNWIYLGKIELPYGKMPLSYYFKKKPIWAPVQPIIERLETCLSDVSDANSYNASPLLAFLNVDGAQAQEKGEQGKAVALKGAKDGPPADVKYVTWDQVISAVKFEVDTLVNFIYSLTQTPNISFEEMKALGDLSGVAFDRVFIDAHLAARKEIEGGYGELIQRGINIEKALLASMETSLKAAFSTLNVGFEAPHFKLEDLEADVALAIQAKEGGLISNETAMGISGLITNVQDEMAKIKAEGSAAGDEGTVMKLKGAG